MDIREEHVPGVANNSNVVLDVQGELEVIAPIAPLVAIVRQNGVVEKYLETIEVGPQSVKDDNIGCDNKKIARQFRINLVQFVKETPSDEEREDFGFPGACRHFQNVTRPIFGKHAARHRTRRIETEQIVFVAGTPNLV